VTPGTRLQISRAQVARATGDPPPVPVVLRLEQAGPVGRTLGSVAEEEGWTLGEARRAVAQAREMFDVNITYAPDSKIFYAVR
jgi:hypothetical protein